MCVELPSGNKRSPFIMEIFVVEAPRSYIEKVAFTIASYKASPEQSRRDSAA
jgi:hypothetical protein